MDTSLLNKFKSRLIGEGYAQSQLEGKSCNQLKNILLQAIGGYRYEAFLDYHQMEVIDSFNS